MTPIKKLTIRGFKSIQNMNELELGNLNVLLGANGAGKSNFISWFEMMGEIMTGHAQRWVNNEGGPNRILFQGVKKTSSMFIKVEFEEEKYVLELEPTKDGNFTFLHDFQYFDGEKTVHPNGWTIELVSIAQTDYKELHEDFHNQLIKTGWCVYHFHDTTPTSGMVQEHAAHDAEYLRPNAENLAPFLYRIRQESPEVYQRIRKITRLAAPFFDDFVLKPHKIASGEELVGLYWTQTDSDYPFHPTQLSDGTLRFICLVTALLQPNPPSTILIDEPELGLHPYALAILGDLLRTASQRMQVIVSTQSVSLVNEFSIDDLIVVERQDGASTFRRLKEEEFHAWLEDYAAGELWEKNVLGGRLPR